MNKRIIGFIFCLILFNVQMFANEIGLRVLGNDQDGYYVNIYWGKQLISDQSRSGELEAYFDNEDYAVREMLQGWKATQVKKENGKIILSGQVYLKRLETDLSVNVIYEIVNKNVVSKQIELQQNNLSLLFYSLGTSIVPECSPSSYWSFDDNMNMGGTVHETYPAAGYILNDTLAIGLLTDAGNRNLWTRNIRRRPSKQGEIGFRAIREICDANLIRISNKDERLRQNNFVKYTFGEVSDFNHPVDTCLYPIPNVTTWKTYHNGYVKKHGNIYKIEKRGKEVSGVRIPYYLTDGFYTIRFKHRSNNPITIRLFKGEGIENKDIIGLHYQSDIPSLQSEWVEQEETVFIANTEDKPIYLLIAASGLNDSSSSLLIKDLEVIRSDAHNYAYHRLEQGKKSVKKVFIFVNSSQATLHDLRLASQIYLAEGLNFVGTTEEKCVYACYQMLMWITSRYNFAPLNVPSINYAPDMYNRDSFWSLMGVYDKEASEEIFNAWASTQDERGAIGTIITPSMGSREVKGNEATLEFLWYAWVNHKLYGTPIPMDKIKKAFEFCMNEYDPDGDGICAAEFVLGQNDVVDYPDKTTDLAVNQGMFAVTMQVAKELGMPVTQDYIEKTNQEYRNFYDNKRGYLVDNRKYPYSITFNSLLPEFVSWWLFIFVNSSQATLHDLRLASQIYLAEGLNFVGTTEEKCVYACYQMLMWITSRYNFAPLNVPSINYAPDMYNRDSFWSLMGVYDKEASEEIFNAWASTQDERGAIGTIITPSMGSREVKGNEATLEFLWYAWVNHKLYGTPIPMDKIKKAFEFCMNEYDPDGDGICAAEFVLGQNDVVDYPDKTTDLAVNQGMFAVTMQVAKELGMPVTQDYIEKTNQEYRNFYDNKRGYLVDNRKYPYSITFNSLLPEFVSWWLFNRPILTSEMVINTLNRIPYRNGYSPIISHVGDIYFTQENKPFSPNMFWDNGVYYNAGSWLREEICGYVAGLKHGWKDAEMRIKKRLAVEINLHPDEPFSHEFLPFDVTIPGCWWPSTRVFSWNVFVLRALEVAGMRLPVQDPGYAKSVLSAGR